MIHSVIFDLDGVLFDGCNFHATTFLEAYNTVLANKKISREYHDEFLNGLSTRKKLSLLGVNSDDLERIYALKQELTASRIEQFIKEDVKVQDICKRLHSLHYDIFCVSNSIRSTVETCLRGMGVIQYFKGIISNEDTVEPKPSPEPYLTLFRKYNLEPKECLIVEDSPHGIESATKSGGNVLAVKDCSDVTIERIMSKVNEF
jgi:beta-phosphoglucomutase